MKQDVGPAVGCSEQVMHECCNPELKNQRLVLSRTHFGIGIPVKGESMIQITGHQENHALFLTVVCALLSPRGSSSQPLCAARTPSIHLPFNPPAPQHWRPASVWCLQMFPDSGRRSRYQRYAPGSTSTACAATSSRTAPPALLSPLKDGRK